MTIKSYLSALSVGVILVFELLLLRCEPFYIKGKDDSKNILRSYVA